MLDVLYAFFLAVQCAALFGGADYLARAGISYASYARSGFFQLVAVAAVNLACLLACLALCKGEGRGLRMVQVLGTLLVAASRCAAGIRPVAHEPLCGGLWVVL